MSVAAHARVEALVAAMEVGGWNRPHTSGALELLIMNPEAALQLLTRG